MEHKVTLVIEAKTKKDLVRVIRWFNDYTMIHTKDDDEQDVSVFILPEPETEPWRG